MTQSQHATPHSSGTGRRIVDLSMPIVEHWRFTPAFEHSEKVSEGQQFLSTSLQLGAHAFTHVDAPRHVDASLDPLGRVDLARLWGDAAIIDLTALGDNASITADHLSDRGSHVQNGDIVLLHTDHESRHATTTPEYWTDAPWVTAAAARWLADRDARAVGFDFPQDRATRSPYDERFARDPAGIDEDWPCHSILLATGIPQIEYLTNLGEVAAPRVTFFALPLSIPESDGAPTRAFALVE